VQPDEHAALLLTNLPGLEREFDRGAVIVMDRDRLRVRSLLLRPPLPQQRDS
jgi:hypothetical protein